ncbi:hypothetical protein ING2D1G_1508 [Peptoniphilus sp. ING2-D1G]|nr:hypothetical protein ING2D1G_1508 [Peptoniphilus sp. ING2-D1G]
MNYLFLSKTELFLGITEDEIKAMLICLKADEKSYKNKEVIYRVGDYVKKIGLVEEGSVNIIDYDYWGNKSIIGHTKKGDIFALSYATIPGKQLHSDVVANENCTILFLNIENLLTVCSENCPYHTKVIHNLFKLSANKLLSVHQRMKHISAKTIRHKLISYLSEQSRLHCSSHFTITFNRQQLSEYLGVDRSALSNELSKMQRDGIIKYEKNEFILKNI